MTQIKKLKNQGVQIYPQTHTKAVIDDNGYTAESRLQAMQDEINQAQLEIGAVQSDLTPTENSSNWVTSGGVYNALADLSEEVFDSLHTQETVDISSLTLKNFYVNSSNVWESSTTYCGKFLPVNEGDVYTLTSPSASVSVVISIVKSMSQTADSAPDFSASFPARIVSAVSYTVTIPSDAHYIWIRTKNAGTDITPTIVRKSEKFALLTDVNNLTENVEALTYPCRIPIDYLAGTSTLQFWIGLSGNWNITSNQYPYYCRITTVKPNTRYRITAKSTRGVNYALLPNNSPVANQQATNWNGGKPKIISVNGYEEVNTEGYEYLYLRWDATNYDYPKTVEECVGVQEALDSLSETVLRKKLDMEFGFIATSGSYLGYNSPMSNENYDWNYWRNTGMVMVKSGSDYTIDTDVAATYIRFYWYDEDRLYIDNTLVSSPSQGTDGLYHATASAHGKFMRVVIYYNSQYSPEVYVNGVLDANCWHACLGSYIPYGSVMNFVTDTYYQTLNSDIAETATVQDTGYKLINRGLLKLPTNYDPDGEPSRLVIYCHGADGFQNWSNNTTSFDVDHIDPTIWINSGYAVMDMDDLTRTEYLQGQDVPTLLTQNCYMRGYEHVLKNYNIRNDGVILCGRSLGGQRVMMLLNSQLPILCCCLIAPSCGFSRYWNMQDRRRITTVYNNFPTTIDVNGVETDINWGSTAEISDIEWAAMQKYYRLVLNTHGILKLLCIPKSDFFATHTIDGVEVSLRSNPETWDRIVFTNWVGKTKIPIKVWYARDDTTLTDPTRNQDLLYSIVNNGGGLCEYHIFATGGHYPERDGATVTYTNKYGETFQNASMVYAEMLQFIRRYEGG